MVHQITINAQAPKNAEMAVLERDTEQLWYRAGMEAAQQGLSPRAYFKLIQLNPHTRECREEFYRGYRDANPIEPE